MIPLHVLRNYFDKQNILFHNDAVVSTCTSFFLILSVCLRCHGHVLGHNGHNPSPFFFLEHEMLAIL